MMPTICILVPTARQISLDQKGQPHVIERGRHIGVHGKGGLKRHQRLIDAVELHQQVADLVQGLRKGGAQLDGPMLCLQGLEDLPLILQHLADVVVQLRYVLIQGQGFAVVLKCLRQPFHLVEHHAAVEQYLKLLRGQLHGAPGQGIGDLKTAHAETDHAQFQECGHMFRPESDDVLKARQGRSLIPCLQSGSGMLKQRFDLRIAYGGPWAWVIHSDTTPNIESAEMIFTHLVGMQFQRRRGLGPISPVVNADRNGECGTDCRCAPARWDGC